MRIGENPEKLNSKKLEYKPFRVIIPVFIPEGNAGYFKDAFSVFEKSIYSLLNTIDAEKTNITIINNNCKKEVTDYINLLLANKEIDKHIHCSENYGKIYTILQEARGCYEDYIAIVDSDVFFFSNWQNEALSIFNNFKNAGVVGLTPDPNTAFYCNNSLFTNEFLFVKKDKVVKDKELELFEAGINKENFFVTKTKNWKEKQFYLETKTTKAVIGAGHFASVYRKEIFKKLPLEKPIYVFPGGELSFLDIPIDKLGYYRLSLLKASAYHLGNSLPDWILEKEIFASKIHEHLESSKRVYVLIPYNFRCLFVRVLRKFNFYK
ncbi:glycosyltransferase family A protein [Flavobacterium sp. N2038]|uniref:glycosyltransferase family A protein n=1 Tax=Flavobacterium sp. N2038 TaxID=2986829 RepID=UPI0022250331|nr:glycosyltransferase family A protein [Flavobacterium sp. N2038]